MTLSYIHILQYLIKTDLSKIHQSYKYKGLVVSKTAAFYLLVHLRYSSFFYMCGLSSIIGYDMSCGYIGIVYNLIVFSRERVLLQTFCERGGSVRSISSFYINANWYEREFSEFFDVTFLNSRDSRTLLLPFNYRGAPLKKD